LARQTLRVPFPSRARLRAFVQRETRLRDVPGAGGVRLHLADDVTTLWHRTAAFLGTNDPPLPYWAFAWSGGLGVVAHVLAHPEIASGRRVLDLGTGSGLCAIVAHRLGARSVQAIDIDPLAVAAAELNARANAVAIATTLGDPLDDPPPGADLIVAGDVSYEQQLAERTIAWLRRAAAGGAVVLLGDPGRRWFDSRGRGMRRVGEYTVRVSREIETSEQMRSSVYEILPDLDA
jgi:predicted nicotinamide N-methyase